jgi:hypothetical protein
MSLTALGIPKDPAWRDWLADCGALFRELCGRSIRESSSPDRHSCEGFHQASSWRSLRLGGSFPVLGLVFDGNEVLQAFVLLVVLVLVLGL